MALGSPLSPYWPSSSAARSSSSASSRPASTWRDGSDVDAIIAVIGAIVAICGVAVFISAFCSVNDTVEDREVDNARRMRIGSRVAERVLTLGRASSPVMQAPLSGVRSVRPPPSRSPRRCCRLLRSRDEERHKREQLRAPGDRADGPSRVRRVRLRLPRRPRRRPVVDVAPARARSGVRRCGRRSPGCGRSRRSATSPGFARRLPREAAQTARSWASPAGDARADRGGRDAEDTRGKRGAHLPSLHEPKMRRPVPADSRSSERDALPVLHAPGGGGALMPGESRRVRQRAQNSSSRPSRLAPAPTGRSTCASCTCRSSCRGHVGIRLSERLMRSFGTVIADALLREAKHRRFRLRLRDGASRLRDAGQPAESIPAGMRTGSARRTSTTSGPIGSRPGSRSAISARSATTTSSRSSSSTLRSGARRTRASPGREDGDRRSASTAVSSTVYRLDASVIHATPLILTPGERALVLQDQLLERPLQPGRQQPQLPVRLRLADVGPVRGPQRPGLLRGGDAGPRGGGSWLARSDRARSRSPGWTSATGSRSALLCPGRDRPREPAVVRCRAPVTLGEADGGLARRCGAPLAGDARGGPRTRDGEVHRPWRQAASPGVASVAVDGLPYGRCSPSRKERS